MQPKLTPREEVVLSLSALGFQPEEIEDYINSDTGTKPKANTNRKHIANAKSKIGSIQAVKDRQRDSIGMLGQRTTPDEKRTQPFR